MFTVPGKPQGKARARTYYNAATKKHCSTTPDNTVLYENFIKDRYLQVASGAFLEREKPVALRIVARYLPPKSVSKKRKASKTVKQYRYELVRLLTYINKPVKNIDSGDISGFMRTYKMIRKVANQTLKNVRAVYSSFFGWLRDRDRIRRNPMVLVESIKVEKKIRKPYTDEERERMLRKCSSLRDKALLEFLYSTAVRVSELSEINREDIRYANKELIVYGKGAKERTVYINERTNMYLKEYLESRKDNDPALFVGSKKPNSRLTKTGIEDIIRRIGEKAGVENAHPHRFRRTALTNALNRGMPLQEAMIFAGHAKSETTMRYCTVNQEGVRYHHFKYLSA